MTEWESEDFTTIIPSLFGHEDAPPGDGYKFRCFDCLGESGTKEVHLNKNGYLLSDEASIFSPDSLSLPGLAWKHPGTVTLFGRSWDKGSVLLWNLNTVFKMASQELMDLDRGAKVIGNFIGNNSMKNSGKDYIKSRYYCIELLLFTRNYLFSLQKNANYYWLLEEFIPRIKKRLIALRRHLGYLINLPLYVYQHCSNSSGNKCPQPAYHLMHIHLDLRWLHLTLLFCIMKGESLLSRTNEMSCSQSSNICKDDLLKHVLLLISELIHLAFKRYEKMESNDVIKKTPFNCTCVQELWILLQIFTDNLSKEGIGQKFWQCVNDQLDSPGQNISVNTYDIGCRIIDNPLEMNSTKMSMFSLWMLYHLARLHNYKQSKFEINVSQDNYTKLEMILKSFVNDEIHEGDMRKCLFFVERLCMELWPPKTEPILILWEYFYKKLESTFYMPGTTPDNLATVGKSSLALVSQVKSYFTDKNSVTNSYQHFLRIIGLHLRRTSDNLKHWNKIKGRVYSKFSPVKMVSLKNVAEYNFISLFITLAASVDILQVEKKMVELVNDSLKMKDSLSIELTKGQLALAILLVEQNHDISRVLQPIVQYFNGLPFKDNQDFCRLFVESMQDIIDCNETLDLGQHVFVDKWIGKYLSDAISVNDITRLIDVLLSITSKLYRKVSLQHLFSDDQAVILTVEKLWDQLRYYLSNATTQTSSPYQISDLTANLAILFYKMSNTGRFWEIFDLFTLSELADIRRLRRFIFQVIEHASVQSTSKNYEKAVIKAWVRCGLICSDNNHPEMQAITLFVSTIPEIKCICNNVLKDIVQTDEPLILFMTSLHSSYQSMKDIHEKQSLREKVYCYMDGIESWLKPVYALKLGDQIDRLFFVVGNMFRFISPLLYVKSKPNSLLQKLLDLLLLPVSVHKPDLKLHPSILSAVRKTLHLFIEGLIKLDPESDNYISRVLRELITIYLPVCIVQRGLFSSEAEQNFTLIIEFCTFDSVMKSFILELVCNNFLRKKSRKPQVHSLMALMFIKALMQHHYQKIDVILLIINHTLDRIFEALMFYEEKSAEIKVANDILNLIFNSSLVSNSDEAKECLMQAFSCLCKDHLAWSSRQLFDLMVNICSLSPHLVTRFMPFFLEHIKQVEERRGVGYDKNLRMGLDRVQMKLRISEQ